MGSSVLRNIVEQLDQFGVEDVVYVPQEIELGRVDPDTLVVTLPFDPQEPKAHPQDMKYFLEISVMREVLDGLELQLGRVASLEEKVKAVRYYAEHDAYIEPGQLN